MNSLAGRSNHGAQNMKRHSALAPIGILCCGLLFSAGASASGIAQLRAFVADTKSARASFAQTVESRSGRRPQLSSGSFLFERPGKFRWTYQKPYAQLIVGDGEKLWIYDQDLNQVTVKKLGQALGESPAALLAGDNVMEKNFVLKDQGSEAGLEWVEATPKAKEGSFEWVRLGFKDQLPQVMQVKDSFGQTTTLHFSEFERNPKLNPSLFRFVPPKGADVVGE